MYKVTCDRHPLLNICSALSHPFPPSQIFTWGAAPMLMSLTDAHWRGLWASRLAFNKLHMHLFKILLWNAILLKISWALGSYYMCCTSGTDIHSVTLTDHEQNDQTLLISCWVSNCELCGLESSLKGCWEMASRRWARWPATAFVSKVNEPWGTWHRQTDLLRSQALLISSGAPHPRKITIFYNYMFQGRSPGTVEAAQYFIF